MAHGMEPSVVFTSSDGAVVVIDVPRSLEESQVLPGSNLTRRIISTPPIKTPWQVPEPKKGSAAKHVSPSAAIADLMTLESVKAALETARADHHGPWCWPRACYEQIDNGSAPAGGAVSDADAKADAARSTKRKSQPPSTVSDVDGKVSSGTLIPTQSCHLLGTIESQREAFLQSAPQFDLIVLDPPWPSRSVKRKSDGYTTVRGMEEARNLLLQIPVASHLKSDGLVAIWVTNKAAVSDLLTGAGGLFSQWGLEPVGEWIWLKITSAGEPVSDPESAWRKPWERLLIARKTGSSTSLPTPMKVMMGVPDVHSRKPNVRGHFKDILPIDYKGLEVFARNLTAGWWSWGNEATLFQQEHHWVSVKNEKSGL
ncbi:MT-A70-domain-containing protein [Astrocystis sublimbata]|nr:MT-A70-domain-containing protein [Astrocystis sublimbata]